MKKQILATLAYADIFDYPLTEKEIWEWLLCQGTEDRKLFARSLQLALDSHLIRMTQGFYYLPGREKIVAVRRGRTEYSKPKIKRAEKVAGILRLIPWIKLIGITGGLARQNAEEGDDIDLFFIVAQNRLWLTRGLVVLILSILGLYRRPNNINNMICPNMFVTEDALKMEPEDPFIAHEVCLMKPIFEKDNAYQKFLGTNLWVKKFLPNVRKWEMGDGRWEKRIINHKQSLSLRDQSSIINWLERPAKYFQLWYMAKKRTTEVISNNLIKFHPQDARVWILEEFEKRLYGLDKM